MFGLFKKKSPVEKLEDKYQELLNEAHALSKVNRMQSDQRMAEAEEVRRMIEAISD